MVSVQRERDIFITDRMRGGCGRIKRSTYISPKVNANSFLLRVTALCSGGSNIGIFFLPADLLNCSTGT